MPDFLPRREAMLVQWSANFAAKLAREPAAYGVSAQQAAAMVQLHDAFASLHRTVRTGWGRSPVNVLAKDAARAAMLRELRALAGRVRANPGVSDAQRAGLGLRPRSEGRGAAIARPERAPWVHVLRVTGRRAVLSLRDPASPMRAAKPNGVAAATLFHWVGEQWPGSVDEWVFARHTTRTRCVVRLPGDAQPGTRVWYTAQWCNPRGEAGPLATPTYARVGFEGPAMDALLRAA